MCANFIEKPEKKLNYRERVKSGLQTTWKDKKHKGLKSISDAEQARLDKYYPIRFAFLKENFVCQIQIQCDGKLSQDVHHMMGRSDQFLWNTKFFAATCRACHQWVEDHKNQARKNGWILYK